MTLADAKKELAKQDLFIESLQEDLDFVWDDRQARLKELKGKDQKLRNQRQQLKDFQEKVELMRTWRGILRTVGQKLGVSR